MCPIFGNIFLQSNLGKVPLILTSSIMISSKNFSTGYHVFPYPNRLIQVLSLMILSPLLLLLLCSYFCSYFTFALFVSQIYVNFIIHLTTCVKYRLHQACILLAVNFRLIARKTVTERQLKETSYSCSLSITRQDPIFRHCNFGVPFASLKFRHNCAFSKFIQMVQIMLSWPKFILMFY